jgi:hypothetical protein
MHGKHDKRYRGVGRFQHAGVSTPLVLSLMALKLFKSHLETLETPTSTVGKWGRFIIEENE